MNYLLEYQSQIGIRRKIFNMSKRGFNVIVDETRSEITEMINSKLQNGFPVTIIALILENVLTGVRDLATSIKNKEEENYIKQLQEETEHEKQK